jgi:hypothetical protein
MNVTVCQEVWQFVALGKQYLQVIFFQDTVRKFNYFPLVGISAELFEQHNFFQFLPNGMRSNRNFFTEIIVLSLFSIVGPPPAPHM